jgi:hypothetical protein
MSAVVGSGYRFGGAAGFGITRSVVIEATGSYAKLVAASDCPGCGGSTFDLGLGVAYHLAQGIALDPWISYGLGFRRTALSIAGSLSGTGFLPGPDTGIHYNGIDVARIALGGDFYPIPELGFGPFVEADAGTYFGRSKGIDTSASAYAFFGVGLRITVDPMRFGQPQPRREKAARR